MKVKIDHIAKNMVRLTVEIEAEQFETALTAAYHQDGDKYEVQGYEKGKAPREAIEQAKGEEIFYQTAANILLNNSYPSALEASKLDAVSAPKVALLQSGKGKSFIYTAEFATRPEVKLGQYRGLKVAKAKAIEIKEAAIEMELAKLCQEHTQVVKAERPIEMGDTAVIDFEGFVDGIPFAGGKGESYELAIGSHSFIDTFEDQLVGKSAGEECDVNVTFPVNYHAANLAGKPALFKVTVKEVRESKIPEVNDEFAMAVAMVETVAELRQSIRERLEQEERQEASIGQKRSLMEQAVKGAEFDVPEAMLEMQIQGMIRNYAQQLASRGMGLEQYLQYTGATMEDLKNQARPEAESNVRSRLVAEAIADAEALEASEEELTAELTKMGTMYNMDAEQVRAAVGEQGLAQMKNQMRLQKVLDLLLETAIEE